MALKSLIFNNSGVCLNSLRRFCLSGVIVPKQDLLVAKIPAAKSLTQPGRANPIPLQGPADAFTEMYSFSGKQGVFFQGIGKITTTGGNSNVTGIGTKFLTQLQVGDVIDTVNGGGTILTVSSDTAATTVANMAANTAQDYFFATPVNTTISGENVFVSITDQAWRRRLFIKESLLLETDQTLMLEFLNYDSTHPASFAPISEGRKWQYEAMKAKEVYNYIEGLRERKQYIQPYWLTLDHGWSALSNGIRNSTEFLTCTGDITLVLFNLYAQAFDDDNGGADVSRFVTANFTDAKTKRSLQNTPIPLDMCAGTAENPFQLPTPLIVEPQTQIQVDFNYLAGLSHAIRVYMTFHGVAIYTGSSYHGSTLTNKTLQNESAKMYEAMSIPQVIPAEAQG